jgi:hypothetical protein
MIKDNVIDSALGFDFSADIIDQEGELVQTGAKTTHPETDEIPIIGNRIGGQQWFTTFNESLLAKIRDYKRINS